MPRSNAWRVLSSPRFADNSLVMIRAVQTVGDDGRAVRTETRTPFSGVVTSDQGDILRRFPDLANVSGSITVTTTTRLVASAGGTEADRVIWGGRTYVVAALNDYSSYGAGFVIAGCTLLDLT